MRDSIEARRCRDCGTEYHLAFVNTPYLCRACAVDRDDYTPMADGEPCADCNRPVWYCSDEDQWFHTQPGECFLATHKARPQDNPNERTER